MPPDGTMTMRLLEAIVEANHRAAADGTRPDLGAGDYGGSLPLVALTCIDARLNPLLPENLGVGEEQFVWLRNAGNIVTGPLSSTMRSLALACAVKGGKEIALIGHTDCQVCKTTVMKLTDAFSGLGVDRARLPENLIEYFGLFASERQNVIRGADLIRRSPIIGAKIPVHGLLLNLQSGQLEWIVNGYETMGTEAQSFATALATSAIGAAKQTAAEVADLAAARLPEFKLGDMKFPDFKIGDMTIDPNRWLSEVKEIAGPAKPETPAPANPVNPASAPEREFDRSRKYRIVGSDQKVYGPVDGAKLMAWINDGRIDWQTPAQREGSQEWKPLADWSQTPKPPTIPLPRPVQPAPRLKKAKRR
jgi:carbonic anhydrase